MERHRPFGVRRAASLAVLALAVTSLAACASARPGARGGPVPGEHSEFMLGSPSFFCSAMRTTDVRQAGAGNRPTNRALAPDGPWLGSIGLRNLLPGSYEYGFGLCLPNPSQPRASDSVPTERLRALGVGVWLKFDF